ncbi:class I SAM-dependent methyltransferase [Gordonia sp. CPCC 206044]|uniref:class I SAM-dependent methyltransferase n=1 Tax=Gordonia sp. CPCC 206044 TaxID=3140793 RepID=UPI003AF3E0C1
MSNTGPESTAQRVALWRALHVEVDAPPHVFVDEVGRELIGGDDTWRARPDMDPETTAGFRASIVGRARFVEDLVLEQIDRGVDQYVILGAGLDTFAQRRPEISSRVSIFEVDQPAPQSWKRTRLIESGHTALPHFVPVDFEANEDWWEELSRNGFDATKPAVVVSTGVTHYLTREATAATVRQVAALAPGSTFALSFLIPVDAIAPEDRAGLKTSETGAEREGTPFVSFWSPTDMTALARDAGFVDVRHVPGSALAERYFGDRTDGLRPSTGEDLIVART